MNVDIFIDTICPWCFIGKRRFERSLEDRGLADVVVRWRAFQLNPGMPDGGMDRQDYLSAKFGGSMQAREIYRAIADAGRAEGIPFAFESIERTPNTVLSHRLLRFAQTLDLTQSDRHTVVDRLLENLMTAYFIEGRDIGSTETLVEIAADCGLGVSEESRAEVRQFLDSDLLEAEVIQEDTMARRAGIMGVPCYVFEGKYLLSGAQPPEVLSQMYDMLEQQRRDGVLDSHPIVSADA